MLNYSLDWEGEINLGRRQWKLFQYFCQVNYIEQVLSSTGRDLYFLFPYKSHVHAKRTITENTNNQTELGHILAIIKSCTMYVL